MTNHYRTLGVDPQAEAVVIRSAYLALIRRYHPDKGGSEADPSRAQAVTAAWDVLRDPERRAAYDETRRARFQPGEGGAAFAHDGPKVRGGAPARNLFLILAAGTVGLGWWAMQQPIGGAPNRIAASSGERAGAEPVAAIDGSRNEGDAAPRTDKAETSPRLPDVRSAPGVSEPLVPPPLPSAEPARIPLRTVEARSSVRSGVAAERVASATPTRVGEERRAAAPAPPPLAPAMSSAPVPARIDLAPLERHLQILTDQSLRFGTEAKRARLIVTRETFLKRLGDCDDDACRRDTYLRRNQEVGEIMGN
jgi:curved DNA-binding protein CbpA